MADVGGGKDRGKHQEGLGCRRVGKGWRKHDERGMGNGRGKRGGGRKSSRPL